MLNFFRYIVLLDTWFSLMCFCSIWNGMDGSQLSLCWSFSLYWHDSAIQINQEGGEEAGAVIRLRPQEVALVPVVWVGETTRNTETIRQEAMVSISEVQGKAANMGNRIQVVAELFFFDFVHTGVFLESWLEGWQFWFSDSQRYAFVVFQMCYFSHKRSAEEQILI